MCAWESTPASRLKDLHRPERIFQLIHPDLPADFLPLNSLDALTTNLPIQLSSFIGRDKEISRAKGLLSKTRLLTLTGSGGCGKTRLALQVAAEAMEEFKRGVWLAELAPVADPALVPQGTGAGQFNRPAAIFVDAAGQIYVTEWRGHRIVRMNDMTGVGWVSIGGPGEEPHLFGGTYGLVVA